MNDQADNKQGFENILKQKPRYLIAVAVLVLIAIYFGLRTDQDRMLSAQADHDHERALMIANKLLEQNPDDSTAKTVIRTSGQLFYHLMEAKLTLNQFRSARNQLRENPEKLSEGLLEARAHIAKAKTLDPKAERLLAFESTLDIAEKQLAHILSRNAISTGQSVISEASNKYIKTTEIVSAAKSSPYLAQFLTFQSSGASIGKPANEIKESIEPHLKKMEKTSQIIVSTGDHNKTLSQALDSYITAVSATVDTVLAPQGTFKEFATTADKSMAEYKNALIALKKELSQFDSIEADISKLVDNLIAYKVFHDHSIYNIMSTNKSLFN